MTIILTLLIDTNLSFLPSFYDIMIDANKNSFKEDFFALNFKRRVGCNKKSKFRSVVFAFLLKLIQLIT